MTNVTVLGTGLMGSGMARSLARAGLTVTAWNRTPEKARPLEAYDITVAEDAESAVRDADVVVTMLFDAGAVEEVMSPLLGTLKDDAVWAQCATVGIEATEHLARTAGCRGVAYVDSPVLGTREPAENGQLIVLAGGPEQTRGAVAPVFDAIGSRTVWVGDQPGAGHRLKLAANAWVLSITGATAQSIGLAARLGVEPRLFLEAISGGALDCAYAQTKGSAMIAGDFDASFSLAGALKDAALIERTANVAQSDGRLMGALLGCFEAAAQDDGDPNDLDMSAIVRAFT